MFVHTLPTTRALSFADHLMSTSYALELTQATEKRANLERVLKAIQDEKVAQESKGSQASSSAPTLLTQKDWLKVVQNVDDYLPWIASMETCLKTDDVIPRGDLVFTWKDTLAATSSKVTLPGVHFELLYALIISAKACSNLAASLIASAGDYENTEAATLDTEGRKKKEDRLRFAADLYCRAAGTFDYAGNHVVREWENDVGTTRLGQLGRSVESTREMCMALSRLAQAEAETLAVRKLLSPTACYQTASRTSAPPLPSEHPSPSLLGKLYLNCAAHFESALSLATTASSAVGVRAEASLHSASALQQDRQASSSKTSSGGLSSRLAAKLGRSSSPSIPNGEDPTRSGKVAAGLLKYLTKSARVSRARAYMWLGVDKGERGDYGDAISFLKLAREQVAELSGSSGAASKLHLGKASTLEHKREQKRHFASERDMMLELVSRWSAAYTQLNDTVGFKPIPTPASLTSQIPAGRGATVVKAFALPVLAFGPGSVGYTARGIGDLGMGSNHSDEGESLGLPRSGTAAGAAQEESYAGQGAYY